MKKFMPLDGYQEYPLAQMKLRSADFYLEMQRRRSVRDFSDRAVPREIIENCLRAAAAAPSGANQQPWRFIAVSDAAVKHRIRQAAETVEQAFYSHVGTRKWVKTLATLGTGPQKAFLETAPYLIVVLAQRYGAAPDGGKQKHYYVAESVGIATGMLIAAVRLAGLVSLPYTPAQMGFLNDILALPSNEKPMLILVVGYPTGGALVPAVPKRSFEEVAQFI